MARPSKYQPAIVEKIIKALEERKGRTNAAKAAKIHYSTFLDWMENKPEFSEKVLKAEQLAEQDGKEYAILKIFSHMEKSWQAAAWWLERRFPDEFKERMEATNKVDAPKPAAKNPKIKKVA